MDVKFKGVCWKPGKYIFLDDVTVLWPNPFSSESLNNVNNTV